MKIPTLLLVVLSMALLGCDTISGVSRRSQVYTLPDLNAVKAKLESYSEVKDVKMWQMSGGRPLTLTGVKKPDEVFYLSYTDHANVRGTLMFTRNYKGEVSYDHYLMDINRRPPQPWIDATWPIMKRVEKDLIEEFGLPEIRDQVKSSVFRVEDPERQRPNKAPEPTTTSVTPPAAQESRQP